MYRNSRSSLLAMVIVLAATLTVFLVQSVRAQDSSAPDVDIVGRVTDFGGNTNDNDNTGDNRNDDDDDDSDGSNDNN